MPYTGIKVRDSLNTIGMLGLKALHVQMAEAIKPHSGICEGSKGKGGTVYASNTASSLKVGHVRGRCLRDNIKRLSQRIVSKGHCEQSQSGST
jgi:hypothetical protein